MVSTSDDQSKESLVTSENTMEELPAKSSTVSSSVAHTPSNPQTPAGIERKTLSQVGTPGSVSGDSASPFSPSYPGSTRDIHNTPRCSIPGGERG